MMLLLNWRFWAAISFAAAQAAFGYFMYHTGAQSEQVAFDVYKNAQISNTLAAQRAVDAKAAAAQAANMKVSEDYETLKTATATDVLTLDSERMRLLKVVRAGARSPAAPASSAGPVPNATPEDDVLAGCIQRRTDVAAEAQQLSNQVVGLQAFITKVCSGPQNAK